MKTNLSVIRQWAILLLIGFAAVRPGQEVLADAGSQEFQCAEGNEKLRLYVSEDQKRNAVFGVKTPHGFSYIGFREGLEIPLSHLVGITGNSERNRENVVVYRGKSDAVSQAKLLIFNERTSSLIIIDVSDFTTSKSQCSKQK